MNVRYENSFKRDLKKIHDKGLKAEVKHSVFSVKKAQTIREIPNLKKLKGYWIHYRIKVDKYRIGVTIEKDWVTFFRFLPRKDFYKYFP